MAIKQVRAICRYGKDQYLRIHIFRIDNLAIISSFCPLEARIKSKKKKSIVFIDVNWGIRCHGSYLYHSI